MKLLSIILKNYKVLFRSKASAAVVVVGPLFIILLVGLAFNNNNSFQVNVGTYSPDDSELTSVFADSLRDDGYMMFDYSSEAECIGKIQEGIVHICITFPPNFSIENNKVNNLTLHVDNSRQNLVYQVIENIKGTVQATSSDVSLELTTDLLKAIQNAQNSTSTNLNKIILLKTSSDNLLIDTNNIITNANLIDLNSGTISLSGIVDDLESLQKDLKDIGDNADDATIIKDDYDSLLSDTNFSGDMNDLIDNLNDLENNSINNVDEVIDSVNSASSNIADLEKKIGVANTAKSSIKTKSNAIKTKLGTIKSDLDSVKSQLEFVQSQINALTVTDAENIVTPVEISVKNVSAENTRLIFIFPSLLMLVIMFVSVMLSSTLIVLEKSGRAFFRNFTTSTKDETFILSTFLTAFSIVLVQVLLLMGAAFFLLRGPLFGNIPVTSLVIILFTALCVMIGMAIGYTFNSQQATNMMAVSVGSVFLLLSDLVLPIETINPALQILSKFNPYVISSEILRKSLLFNAGFVEVQINMLMLFLYSILIFIIILATHKISKIKYLGSMPHRKIQSVIPKEGDSFSLGNNLEIKTLEDLYIALIKMNNNNFTDYIDNNKKEFLLWIKNSINNPKLAKKFKKLTHEEMITFLDDIIDKKKLLNDEKFLKIKHDEQKRESEVKTFLKNDLKNNPKKNKVNKLKKKLFSKNKNIKKDIPSEEIPEKIN